MTEYSNSTFWNALVRQVRAIDQWGSWDNWTDEKILTQKFIRSREEMSEIPIMADVDERVLNAIRLFLQGLAQAVEKESGLMTSAILDVNHEGFGRGLIIHKNVVLFEKVYREAHRFHFTDLDSLVKNGEKMLNTALQTIEKMKGCLDR